MSSDSEQSNTAAHLSPRHPIPECLLHEKPKYFIREWSIPAFRGDYRYFDASVVSLPQFAAENPFSDLPDDVVVEIMRRLHPDDRVRSASLVCQRWHRLAYARGLWTQIRIALRSRADAQNVRLLLQKESVRNSLRRIEFEYVKNPHITAEDVLPDKFPNVVQYKSTNERFVSDLAYLNNCFPKLRTLILSNTRSSDAAFGDIFPIGSFPNLRCLSVDRAMAAPNLREFLRLRRDIELLDLSSLKMQMHTRITQFREDRQSAVEELSSEGGELHLKKLSLSRVHSDVFTEIVHLARNLVALEIHHLFNNQLWDLTAIRHLHSLEHLHLIHTEQSYSDMKSLFAAAKTDRRFPSRLKYLSIREPKFMDNGVFDRISASCPELRSLCVLVQHHYSVVSDDVIRLIGERLRKLKYLRVNFVSRSIASMLNELDDDCLPELRYAASGHILFFPPNYTGDVHFKSVIKREIDELNELLVKRKKLNVVMRDTEGHSLLQLINGRLTDPDDDATEALELCRLWSEIGFEEGQCCVQG